MSPQTLNSIQTEGVTFTGTQAENLTLTSSVLQMPEGSEISLPSATHGVSYKFESGVGITLTKGDDQTIAVNAPGGTVQNADFPEGLKKIAITSGSAELSTLVTRDLSTDGDEDHQIVIDFSTNVATQESILR